MAKSPLPCPTLTRQLLRYDAETGNLFWRTRQRWMFKTQRAFNTWNARYAGKEALNSDLTGYRVGTINYHTAQAHRAIWAITYGYWPTGNIDHKDGNPSNNLLSNLRDVSQTINTRNQKLRKNNTTGALGVFTQSNTKKWRAAICVSRKKIYLGYFDTFDDAVAARKVAEKKYGFHANHGSVR